MHDPVRARYPYASLKESLSRVLHLRPRENEDFLEYRKKFKQQWDILLSHVGENCLTEFISNSPKY